MYYWNETPLFRFLVAFICGILLAVYFPILPVVALCIAVFLCAAVFIMLFLWKIKNAYRRRWIAPLAGMLFTFFSGYLLTVLGMEKNCTSHFRNKAGSQGFIGIIDQPLIEKEKSHKTFIKIISVQHEGKQAAVSGKCLAYFIKDSLSAQLKYGDLIFFIQSPAEVRNSPNPQQFDYKRWLSFNRIYDQVFLETGKWKLMERGRGSALFAFSYELRDTLLSIFLSNGIAGQEYAVLSALILGCDDGIDQEVISAYAASGALHVLSVSGLHVGIIYVAINFLLSFLNKRRRTKVLKAIFIIVFLWFYALLTGLSPSVLRSATMLSFIIIGSLKRHHTQLYNTLAASAFFLLCLDPFLIMQVGFQLSYAAVFGIILLYQRILSWLDPPGWLLRQIWSITAVSLAAQVATFPLGLLYFHQFPVYFLLSNLIVIPISTVIIYGGILILFFSAWNAAAVLLGMAISWVVHGMNAVVIWIEALPYSLVTGISVTVPETLLMYLLTGSIIACFVLKQGKYLLVAFSSGVLVLFSQIQESISIRNQLQIIVYSIKGSSVLNIIDGNKSFLYADEEVVENKNLMQFNIYSYWWNCGIDENDIHYLVPGTGNEKYICYRNFIQYGEIKIAMLKDSVHLNPPASVMPVDLLVLSNNLQVKIHSLLTAYRYKKLVMDSSFNMKSAGKLVSEAKASGFEMHSVLHNGAFVYDMQRK